MFRRIILTAVFVIFAALVIQRIGRYASSPERETMPATLLDHEERQLFESPQGKYSRADIAANGRQLPSERYRGFRAVHNFRPQPGDRLCPITRTQSNPACTWIVDGQTYEFCCPPCIAEFVRNAKQSPDDLLPAESFVAK